jgi:dihydroorotate dehydrogenase electron transfer subunit
MKKYCIDLTVKEVKHINEKYVLIVLTDDKPLPEMKPGQFVEVKVENSPATFLRRPISINDVDYDKNELHLLVACIGEGTKHMGMLKSGEKLNIMLPLGNGFTLPESKEKKHLLIGGGVGVAPLLFLGKKIKEMGGEPTFLLGARSEKDLLMIDFFEKVGRVFITTEDGSKGEKGFVTNHSILKNENFDFISTCGPKPMMAAVSKCAEALGIECEVSLENKMACGLGACLCCVEKTKDKGNICICTEGPVINAKRLNW